MKSSAAAGSVVFKVRYVVVVDRPWLRNETYPVVPAGHRIPTVRTFESRKQAIAYFEMIRAEEDFSSEYNTNLECWAQDLHTGQQTTVRKCITRDSRDSIWQVRT